MPLTLELYLDELKHHLESLPTHQRETELREIESHLRAMIEAREAGGTSQREAVNEALLQFGSAWHIGRDLSSAYQRQRTESLVRSLAGGIAALACQYGIMSFSNWGGGMFLYPSLWVSQFWASSPTFRFLHLCFSIAGYALFVTPLISGLLASWIAPRRGWWMALASFAVVALASASVMGNSRPLVLALLFVPGLLFGAGLGKLRRSKKSRFALT